MDERNCQPAKGSGETLFASKNLISHQIPLSGIHLIEASAGTGKTFNITRIYLRLLLEKKLTVQQILVMTFTKDATEEIRGRIDSFIRLALNEWQTLTISDEYFIALAKHIEQADAKILLTQALLYLDEAAIYTIHGFCKTVLSQHAFASGVSFNATLEGEQHAIVLQAAQDWYRQLASNDKDSFLKVVEFWPVPQSMVSQFAKAINKNCALELESPHGLIEDFIHLVNQAKNDLIENQSFLFEALVLGKKADEQNKRSDEFDKLVDYLSRLLEDHHHVASKMPDDFIDGRRFSRAKDKATLIEIFASVNLVKKLAKSLLQDIAKLNALAIIKRGIVSIRTQVAIQKERQNLLTFDDLITHLADHLSHEQCHHNQNTKLADKLFNQFPVALIDEFQDTDSAQFSILKNIYYQRTSGALMMIGDPKQAIYGFRGGDVFAYMSARDGCDHQWLMDTNWRSTQQMVQGYNRLFYGNHLDSDARDVFGYNIPYHPVKPSPKALLAYEQGQMSDASQTALNIIHFAPDEIKRPISQSYRQEMAVWCANEIIHLLSQPYQSIEAKDIALLVRDGTEAAEIKQALFNAGLPSVYLSNRANLLHSEQTKQLIQLLKGILFVENERLFCASLASPLLPYGPQALYQLQGDEYAWQELKYKFGDLRADWLNKGFITMALKLMHDHMEVTGDDSERCLTNLIHLFEILQNASQRYKQPQELLHWFEQQSISHDPELESELRLESEENLIRIITQHGSKGLEYPVVFIPFATRHKDPLKFGNRNVQLVEYHNKVGDLTLSLSGSKQAKQAMADEAYAEMIRLLYVAVTRAEKRCYILSTEFDKCYLSPLGLTCGWKKETNIIENLLSLASDNPNDIKLSVITEPVVANTYEQKNSEILPTKVGQFHGVIERDWWMSSFTALCRNVKDIGVSSPDRDHQTVESNLASNQNILRFAIEKGAHTGNLLHDIFEHLNFNQPNWEQAFKWPLAKYGELPRGFSQDDLALWLNEVISTPLLSTEQVEKQHIDTSFCLADIDENKTLREVEFYFPLEQANTKALSKLLNLHRKTSGMSQHGFVSVSFHQYLKGMMHGFIDLVFQHKGKFYVGDYKSNYLGEAFSQYNHQSLSQDVIKHHYDLQYLIYSLALHRYLKINIEDYQPARDFGGVYYFYLRGMTSNKNHLGSGVYFRDISAEELNTLDKIFSGQCANVALDSRDAIKVDVS